MIDIDSALHNKRFVLFYQPKIDVETHKIVGAEALIRLKDKDSYVLPYKFIPQAEESGEIIKIDKWVFHKVITDAREIFTTTNDNIKISFNVSAKHFEEETLIKDLENIFLQTQDFLGLFEIEITESAFLDDIPAAKQKLKTLKEIGFSISIDDFGIGYGCLTYLKEFDIDTLKIDKSFIDEVHTNQKVKNIVESLIYLCDKLHIKSVAEGVEDLFQVDTLTELGCNEIQGYYYAKPLSLKDFIIFTKSFNKTKKLKYIQWSDKYTTGSYGIDSHRMIIINLLNHMFEILKDKEKRKDFSFDHFLSILDVYTFTHFKMEEKIMKKYKYPYFTQHINEHKKFFEEYNNLKKHLTNIDERNLYDLFNLLKDWFINHEIESDKKMIDYIKNKYRNL